MFTRVLCAAALLLLAVGPALAQDAGVQPLIDFSPLFSDFIVPLAGTILSGLAIWALTALARKFGFDIEARHREALQEAIKNAAGLALQKVGDRSKIGVGSPVMADAVNYVIRAAPDALARFGITRESIAEKVLSKLPQIAPPAPEPPVVIVQPPAPQTP